MYWENWQALHAGCWCWPVDATWWCSRLWAVNTAGCLRCHDDAVCTVGAQLSRSGNDPHVAATWHQMCFFTQWYLYCHLWGLLYRKLISAQALSYVLGHYFYAFSNIVAGGIMVSECLCVCPCVRPCVCESQTNIVSMISWVFVDRVWPNFRH